MDITDINKPAPVAKAKAEVAKKKAAAKNPDKGYKGPFGRDISKVVPYSKEWYKLANTKGID